VAASAQPAARAEATTPSASGAEPVRRVRIGWRTTREGKVFFLVTLGVGVAAINTGNNLLFLVLGFLLALVILSGVMSEIALRRVRIERRLPERAFVGQTALIEIALSNAKARLASYSLEVEDVADGVPTERRCYFLKVAPGAQQIAAYRRVGKRRGVLRLVAFRLATRYPFGIIEKSRTVSAPAELVVYPALVPVADSSLRRAVGGLEVPSLRAGPGAEVAGLRDHRDGDEARSVHWRRTASLGRLVVRERARDEATRLALVVDNARPDGAGAAWDAAFELAISRAAWLAQRALQRGAAVEVLARGVRSPLITPGRAPDPAWRFLALLEPIAASSAPPLSLASGGGRTLHVDALSVAESATIAAPALAGAPRVKVARGAR
jgi:uncharacterized protein (DUF58 family)